MVLFDYNGTLALESKWLWENELIVRGNYDTLVRRNKITVLKRGCRNTHAVISYEKLPHSIKNKVDAKLKELGEVSAAAAKVIEKPKSLLESNIKDDQNAKDYFSKVLPDGRTLPPDTQTEYYNNAIILRAMNEALCIRKSYRNSLCNPGSNRGVFATVCAEVVKLDKNTYPHTLPKSVRNLRTKYKEYLESGYRGLIHSNYFNNHARKVTANIEHLLLSLCVASNNPYAEWVWMQYLQFIYGEIDVVNTKTGELFKREDFYNDKGEPVAISESTVWNYLNNPANKAIIDSVRLGYHDFNQLIRPHYHREAPQYSLSKVSLDDRELPRKMHDGNRVKAYYAYDVCSGVLLGAAYSKKKNTELFIDCLREMFRTLDGMNLGLPLEMEVENHLVRQFENDLLLAGNLFPFVRWCAPTNSQEKHAEQFNHQKKYGYEKRYQDGIGRFYSKLDVNRTKGERVYNEETDRYEIKTKTYSYEQLVADDLMTIHAYNNGLHRNQKRYPGKTRMQVFMEKISSELVAINRPLLLRYIGNCTTTSIVRNQYVQVQYNDYQLATPDVLRRLKPNNYTVQAYWLPDKQGIIKEAHLYQDNEFLCTAARIEKFTTAAAEHTEKDDIAMSNQAKYIAKFDKTTKQGRELLANTLILEKTDFDAIKPIVVEEAAEVRKTDFDIDELLNKYSVEQYKEVCIEVI